MAARHPVGRSGRSSKAGPRGDSRGATPPSPLRRAIAIPIGLASPRRRSRERADALAVGWAVEHHVSFMISMARLRGAPDSAGAGRCSRIVGQGSSAVEGDVMADEGWPRAAPRAGAAAGTAVVASSGARHQRSRGYRGPSPERSSTGHRRRPGRRAPAMRDSEKSRGSARGHGHGGACATSEDPRRGRQWCALTGDGKTTTSRISAYFHPEVPGRAGAASAPCNSRAV